MFNNNNGNRYDDRYSAQTGYDYGFNPRNLTVPASFLNSLYGWMTVGLGLTAGVAYFLSPTVNPELFTRLTSGPLWLLFIVQIGIVGYHSANWQNLSTSASLALFLSYAALNGITLSPIAYMYTGASLVQTFMVAAGTFCAMSVYGYFTENNMLSMGSYLRMGIIGLCIAGLVNIFFASSQMDIIISIFGVVLFTVLIAYDTQMIKALASTVHDRDEQQKVALIGALKLYLDVINLILYLLRFFGDRRKN